MRKLLFAVAVSCLFAGLVPADGITSSTFCSTSIQVGAGETTQSMTGPIPCYVSLLKNSASASVDVNPMRGSADGYIGASIAATTRPTVDYTYPLDTHGLATADATITIQYTFTTTGSVRPGYVETDVPLAQAGHVTRSNGDSDDVATVRGSIGSALSVSCSQFSPGECSGSAPGTLFPTTLGQDFVFTEQITLDTSSSSGFMFNTIEQGAAALDLEFRLLEADGTTPVTVDLVPEPSALALLIAAGLLLLTIGRRFRCGV